MTCSPACVSTVSRLMCHSPNLALRSQHPCLYTAWPWPPRPLSVLALTEALRIFLTQQGPEKSHFPGGWFPKHWALLVATGPSTRFLHRRGSGAIGRMSPPQPLCHLYVWLGLFFFFFKKAIIECTKAKKKKKVYLIPVWSGRWRCACGILCPKLCVPISCWFSVFSILEKQTKKWDGMMCTSHK